METVKIILLCIGVLIVGIGIGIMISKSKDGWEIVDEDEISEEILKSMNAEWEKFSQEMDLFRKWKNDTGRFYCQDNAISGVEKCTEQCGYCQQNRKV